MSLQTHIGELKAKHRALDMMIEEELQHPSTDDLQIAELKRQKLRIKDQIVRLQQQAA